MSTRRLAFGLGGAAALALLTAAPAAAHVTVQPGSAAKGSFAKLAFRVPNESQTAGTIRLEVTFPVDPPVPSVRTRPMPGWTAEVRVEKLATPFKTGDGEITEAVRSIVWTAQPGVRVGPGEFDEFELSGGPLPDADQLLLPTTQTFDDGTVVRWDAAPPAAGADEPEHPAPVLKLVARTAEDGDDPGDAAGAASSPAPPGQPSQAAVATAAGRDDTARWLGGIGLVAGALGTGLAGGALLANRRRGSLSSGPSPGGPSPGGPSSGGAASSGPPAGGQGT